MSRKNIFRLFLTMALLLSLILIGGLLLVPHVSADCGTPPTSSCASCHSPNNHVEVMGAWNHVHLEQDICINCHGGNGTSMDKVAAHTGLVAQPLTDIFTNCYSCHPADYVARADQMAASLHVSPGSCATPTSIAVLGESGGPDAGRGVTSPGHSEPIPFWKAIAIIGSGLAGLTLFFLGLGWLNSHRVQDPQ